MSLCIFLFFFYFSKILLFLDVISLVYKVFLSLFLIYGLVLIVVFWHLSFHELFVVLKIVLDFFSHDNLYLTNANITLKFNFVSIFFSSIFDFDLFLFIFFIILDLLASLVFKLSLVEKYQITLNAVIESIFIWLATNMYMELSYATQKLHISL